MATVPPVARRLSAGLILAAQAAACSPAVPDRPDWPFVDRAAEVGLSFSHFNGMSGEYYIVEMMGPGGALFDYDGDGDLDAYLVQGGMLGEGKSVEDASLPPPDPFLGDRLYKNLLRETGRLAFEDVTSAARLESTGYGMGATVGDYDGDGSLDIYVTNFGPNVLLRNRGDGTFEDVTEVAGVSDRRWSTAAAFVDYDLDGDLDLYVANYVDFTLATHRTCFTPTLSEDYCGPSSYGPVPDRLFRNRGDGTFEDVTGPSQLARRFGPGLGVVAADLNRDGRVDLYVANDGQENQLWINRGDGTFGDEALVSGCALNRDGRAEASMGIDAADFDGDGDDDLFMTHLTRETNTLYRNDGRGYFRDETAGLGLGVPSIGHTGFGTAWIDYDNDGLLDLVVVNGAAEKIEKLARRGDPHPLHERNLIFRQIPDGFEDVTDRAGPAFALSEVSRGAAFGDVDDDGDTDVLILNNAGAARLLVNEVGNLNRWLGLRVVDETGRRGAIGARVELVRPSGSSVWRRVRVAASYLSSSDPRVLFGLGRDPAVAAVRVHWPGGTVEEWRDLQIDSYTELRRGTGGEVRSNSERERDGER